MIRMNVSALNTKSGKTSLSALAMLLIMAGGPMALSAAQANPVDLVHVAVGGLLVGLGVLILWTREHVKGTAVATPSPELEAAVKTVLEKGVVMPGPSATITYNDPVTVSSADPPKP